MEGWTQGLLAHEPGIRLGVFLAVLAAMAAWEALAPRRVPTLSRTRRWPSNLGIVLLDGLLVRVLLPLSAVALATLAQGRGWGLLNAVAVPNWLALLGALVLLDLAIYLQHVLFHAVPALWRLHRVHHADLHFDVTTGARFHPIEILLSMLVKFAVIAALGAPPESVLAFELLLNATAMFNHSNVRMPSGVDRLLRAAFVTPDMHRVHHSIERDETNSNFGFNLAVWDRLFGTYRAQPRAGHEAMRLGIPEFREPAQCASLPGMLAMPFHGGRRRGTAPLPGSAARG